MSGSSNRLSYDVPEFNQRVAESVTPLEYQLYSGKYLRDNWCGKIHNKTSELAFGERVSIENDVLNIDRKSSKASIQKYQPPCDEAPSCNLKHHNFSPALLCDRNVVWTNLVKPTNPGFDPSWTNEQTC